MIADKSERNGDAKKMTVKTLRELSVGDECRIVGTAFRNSEKRRMLDLGIVRGTRVKALQKSPCGDPVAYTVRGAVLAIRGADAEKIYIG